MVRKDSRREEKQKLERVYKGLVSSAIGAMQIKTVRDVSPIRTMIL